MNSTPPNIPPRSIAARAADGGVIIGGVIMLLVLGVGFSTAFGAASILVWGGTLAMPFILYSLLRRSYGQTNFGLTTIELWAEGIAMFFLGSLVPATVVYLLLKFVAPDFMTDQLNMALGELGKMEPTPQSEQLISTLTTLRDSGLLPTPTQVAAQLIAFNMFAGMILSLIEANILVIRYNNPQRRERLSKSLASKI
ncbi:MAG: DUF4199 domain-containing protein [Bacteroidales bacterium]|nr:DUF4199 domain-containing protein [Bacteroidales bacterium]